MRAASSRCKAQSSLINANQRHTKLSQHAANAQHGAVTAHHQCQVALGADARNIQNRELRQAGVAGGVFLNCNVTALGI